MIKTFNFNCDESLHLQNNDIPCMVNTYIISTYDKRGSKEENPVLTNGKKN